MHVTEERQQLVQCNAVQQQVKSICSSLLQTWPTPYSWLHGPHTSSVPAQTLVQRPPNLAAMLLKVKQKKIFSFPSPNLTKIIPALMMFQYAYVILAN